MTARTARSPPRPLEQRRVRTDEGLVERQHYPAGLLHFVTGQADGEGELLCLEWRQADARLDERLVDPLRRLRRHFLDVHAAVGAGHEDRLLRGAIHEQTHVEFALDREPFLDQHPPHALTGRAGLVGDQLHAENSFCVDLDGVEPLGHLHPAALAAAARVNLRLDNRHGAAEALGDLNGVLRRHRHLASRHRDAVLRQDRLGLIFVNLHR